MAPKLNSKRKIQDGEPELSLYCSKGEQFPTVPHTVKIMYVFPEEFSLKWQKKKSIFDITGNCARVKNLDLLNKCIHNFMLNFLIHQDKNDS